MTDMKQTGPNGDASAEAANEFVTLTPTAQRYPFWCVVTPAMRLLDLQTKHRALDARIHEMYEFPYQNQILLQRLKKEKLRLKDAIIRLKDDMIPDLNA